MSRLLELLAAIRSQYRLSWLGIHGVGHWASVLDTGLRLANGRARRNYRPRFARDGVVGPRTTSRRTGLTLMLNGTYDLVFPYETSQLPYFELPRARGAQEGRGTRGQPLLPNTDRARESLAWLDQHLGPVP